MPHQLDRAAIDARKQRTLANIAKDQAKKVPAWRRLLRLGPKSNK